MSITAAVSIQGNFALHSANLAAPAGFKGNNALSHPARAGYLLSGSGTPKSGVPSSFQPITLARVWRFGSYSGSPVISL
ncbi:hypothetical protein SAMN05216192_1149 [Paenibacillus typhae]|uniref:Uncharacterized protein n=1 Tax=Paenibacillus typhae TaxID=1174501 RepID=A0A1G8S821_9BACL|nr:hypothetical protein SAMN05216192_1149 [Paenibacillus typhae]